MTSGYLSGVGSVEAADALVISATPAFDGWVRSKGWTAAAVNVENPGEHWKGRIGVTQNGYRYETDLEVAAGGKKRVWLAIQSAPRIDAERFIDFEPSRGETVEVQRMMELLAG